jgi:hypothetical protein
MLNLISYAGNPIRKFYPSIYALIAAETDWKEPMLLGYVRTILFRNCKTESNIVEVQKLGYSERKNADVIFVARTNTDWYRIATREEANNFDPKKILIPRQESENRGEPNNTTKDSDAQRTAPNDDRDGNRSTSGSLKTVRRKNIAKRRAPNKGVAKRKAMR